MQSFELTRLETHAILASASRLEFANWQTRFYELIVGFEGFVDLEFSSCLSTQFDQKWEIKQVFDCSENLKKWFESQARQELLQQLNAMCAQKPVHEKFSSVSSSPFGVTEMIVTEINPSFHIAFHKWLGKIHAAESLFPGFQKVYVRAPKESGMPWITFLQFDHLDHLEKWLTSHERSELLKEAEQFIRKIGKQHLNSSFLGWFGKAEELSQVPPLWKQTCCVLLVLFPIVMFELKYLSPLLKDFNSSLATFIGNAISVSLISWPFMPLTIYFLNGWLDPSKATRASTIWGSILMFLLYLIEIGLFWNF